MKQVHKVEKEGESAADQMYTLPRDGLQFSECNVEKKKLLRLIWMTSVAQKLCFFTKSICLAHKIGHGLCNSFSSVAKMLHECLFHWMP